MGSALTATVLRIIGLGLVLAAASEVFFYPVTIGAHLGVLIAFYGPLAYVAWLLAVRAGIRTWAGAFWAACLFGFMIEGIPVPVLYEAVPFTILWTSIAWHAVISVALGLWAFRRLMARGAVWQQVLGCVLAGIYLGAWTVELWSLDEETLSWTWTPTADVARQLLAGWGMFLIGHLALDFAARFTSRPMRWELPVLGGFAALLFTFGNLIAVFPLSLILPVLAGLSWWMMWLDGDGTPEAAPFIVRLSNLRVPLQGYAFSILVPISAITTVSLLQAADIQLESSAIHIMWAGPVSLGLVIWSIWSIWRKRAAA